MQESFSESHEGDVHEAVDVPVCVTLYRCAICSFNTQNARDI